MHRLLLTALAVAWVGVVVPVRASVATVKPVERPKLHRLPDLPLSKVLKPETRDVPPPAEAEVTDDTEVTLDGKPCALKDVPTTATVVRMVLGKDGKRVTEIDFRSGR